MRVQGSWSDYYGPNPDEEGNIQDHPDYMEGTQGSNLWDEDLHWRTCQLVEEVKLEPQHKEDLLYYLEETTELTNGDVLDVQEYLTQYLPNAGELYAPSQADLARWIRKIANL